MINKFDSFVLLIQEIFKTMCTTFLTEGVKKIVKNIFDNGKLVPFDFYFVFSAKRERKGD